MDFKCQSLFEVGHEFTIYDSYVSMLYKSKVMHVHF